jgi:radical SAM-linked protein
VLSGELNLMTEVEPARYRITFAITHAMRYVGHLDLLRAWERTLRRAELPLAYTQGFHKHPRIQIAAALPLGCTAAAEVMELWLETEFEPGALGDRLSAALPPGLRVSRVEPMPLGRPHFERSLVAGDYRGVAVAGGLPADIGERVQRLLSASSLPRERRGKAYDLRPLLLGLVLRQEAVPSLGLRLSLQAGATGRPDEVAEALGLQASALLFTRERLLFKDESGVLHGSDEGLTVPHTAPA